MYQFPEERASKLLVFEGTFVKTFFKLREEACGAVSGTRLQCGESKTANSGRNMRRAEKAVEAIGREKKNSGKGGGRDTYLWGCSGRMQKWLSRLVVETAVSVVFRASRSVPVFVRKRRGLSSAEARPLFGGSGGLFLFLFLLVARFFLGQHDDVVDIFRHPSLGIA